MRLLLTESMINTHILLKRIGSLVIEEPLREGLVQWVQKTAEEL